MKRIGIICLILLFCRDGNSQRNNTIELLDSAISLVKSKSIYSSRVDWAKIIPKAKALLADANTTKDAIPAIRYVFEATNDFHGQIGYRGNYYKHKGYTRDTTLISAYINKQFESRIPIRKTILENGIGYLLIPSVPNRSRAGLSKVAQEIQDSLCALNPQGLKGIIIDLRLNGGGNMFPMISGVGNLIGNGKSGAFMKGNGIVDRTLTIKDGILYIDTTSYCEVVNTCQINKNIKIAVLISPATGSSGEATALAFKHRANTRFFGEATYGFTSSTEGFYLQDSVYMLLSTSIMADRKNNPHAHVMPDVTIRRGDDFGDLMMDQKIMAAMKWIKE